MNDQPQVSISESARRWLLRHGGVVTVRYSPRHGCCGGEAAVPVVEPHAPDNPEGFTRLALDGVDCYLAAGLEVEDTVSVSLEGFWYWRRLYVEGIGMRSRKDV
ncbi:CC/Se motif family (seleno)protein [Thiohalomonas denitrificans]|uniref:Fe-S cluster assembly iron-binding protein IscA n=1 Tax=Thiohalomonas denitrificans TaxID=415747 RepID=A0A1G5PYY7_9GAMM|nr:CC/Se motif family (seleno)protein [Thiohalomonas denitrificans]SCZ54506.1 hypothetical protein SAMN03097708_00981 [Thiohalomonas denitrificans]